MNDLAKTKRDLRLAYLDNIRIYLTTLVIVHHASIAFGGGGSWVILDPSRDNLTAMILLYFTAVNQSYFMSAFFLLAGYFTPGSLEKKGSSAFLKDRLIRLGIPLLVYSTLIININSFLVKSFWLKESFSWVWGYYPGHLWFLQVLLLFAFIYVIYSSFLNWFELNKEENHPIYHYFRGRFSHNWILVFSIVLLTSLTFLLRIFFPVGQWIGGIQPAHFVHYIFCFFVGILAYREKWFSQLTRSQAVSWGIVALVMLPVFFFFLLYVGAFDYGAPLTRFLGGLHWESLAYATWESIMMVAILIFLLYFFRENVTQTGRCERALASSVYTVYIIHQTILIALDIFIAQLNIPSILKFLLVAIIAVPMCFLVGILIRKFPGAHKVL